MKMQKADGLGVNPLERLVLVVGFALLPLVTSTSLRAQSYTVLYNFSYNSVTGTPAGPLSGFVADQAGNLYGTTEYGGTSDLGTVYELLAPDYSRTLVLHSFRGGVDGETPQGPVVRHSAGDLYGTTTFGAGSGCYGGCGIVFGIDAKGIEHILHTFTGGADGGEPVGGLVPDSAGNLYGTTALGGVANGCGGYGCGVVFKVDRSGNETVLYTFTGGADGGEPYAGLIRDGAGNLYGTTEVGGDLACPDAVPGCGVVFKLDPSGNQTVLYSFTGSADGGGPGGGTLVLDSSGNLYGTATFGGSNPSCTYTRGCGVVYQVSPAGIETVLYNFGGLMDGRQPYSLLRDAKGNLYGTALYGGNLTGSCDEIGGCGVVFQLTPGGTERVLYAFDITHGNGPVGTLRYRGGYLYGTTVEGGANGYGVAFRLQP